MPFWFWKRREPVIRVLHKDIAALQAEWQEHKQRLHGPPQDCIRALRWSQKLWQKLIVEYQLADRVLVQGPSTIEVHLGRLLEKIEEWDEEEQALQAIISKTRSPGKEVIRWKVQLIQKAITALDDLSKRLETKDREQRRVA